MALTPALSLWERELCRSAAQRTSISVDSPPAVADSLPRGVGSVPTPVGDAVVEATQFVVTPVTKTTNAKAMSDVRP